MLVYNSLFGEVNKINIAIDRLKFACQLAKNRGKNGLYVAFSGGKDSIVIAELCRMAKIEYSLNYNITGIDPPELIYFMRENYPGLIWHPYINSMWELIAKKGMPPTRIMRYCCSELKERGGKGEFCVTGVRWAESVRRRNTRMQFEKLGSTQAKNMLFNDNAESRKDFENCALKGKYVINPIVDWEDTDVWEFIKLQNLKYCKLYDEGEKRIGCIGCPMQSKQKRLAEFAKYPKFKNNYIRAFEKMLKNRKNPTEWKNGQEVFDWWIGEDVKLKQQNLKDDYNLFNDI